jgi:hypothetical protein
MARVQQLDVRYIEEQILDVLVGLAIVALVTKQLAVRLHVLKMGRMLVLPVIVLYVAIA